MSLPRWSLALLLALPAALAAGDAPWNLGAVEARVIEAGYRQDPKSGAWSVEVDLRLVNKDRQRPFHQQVQVSFSGPDGRPWVWKTFVSLAPRAAQHRRVSTPPRLDCQGPLESCPILQVRVGLGRPGEAMAAVDVPHVVLGGDTGPPEGQPLYVAQVLEGGLLELTSGQKVRVLGLPPRQARPGARQGSDPALDWTWEQVMDAPLRLAYDGDRRDAAGHWLAHVQLADGRDLAAELLKLGLCKLDATSARARVSDYAAFESDARKRGLGLWKR
ncbi:MAG TPA: thermonuclease family protein [bacterium]|nr:thermonuclease family protein [bacterium]